MLSGGQDSATCLAMAARETEVVQCLFMDYGQRHLTEQKYARHVARHFGVPLVSVAVSVLRQIGDSALLRPGDINGVHRQGNLPASFVPGRNLVFLLAAAGFAAKLDCAEVWTGVCQTDGPGYPDCRRATMDAMEAVILAGMGLPIQIVTPLMNLSKAATFRVAARLGVLRIIVENTLTCYEGVETLQRWGRGCGQCGSCLVRQGGHDEYLLDKANALEPADNDRSREVYAHKPHLGLPPNREEIITWLEWNDPNGDYSDDSDDFVPLPLAALLVMLRDALED